MAALWRAVVCRLHHSDYRQLDEGGHSYGALDITDPSGEGQLLIHDGKSGFVAFDQYKTLLAGPDGKMSGPSTVLAGFGAGVTESLLAVTPTESIKTTL